jgi:hypothetical protein
MIVLLIIITFLIILNFYKIIDDTIPQTYNGKTYKVRRSTPESQLNAAQKLEYFRSDLEKLVDYCYQKKIPTVEDSERLYNRFQTTKIHETASSDASAAYVINKGEELRVCLNGNENDTMFVLLHELAHIMSESYGHNSEFKKNMDFLVKEAVKVGIYQPVDYTKTPIEYCGVNISNTPCHNNKCLIGSRF